MPHRDVFFVLATQSAPTGSCIMSLSMRSRHQSLCAATPRDFRDSLDTLSSGRTSQHPPGECTFFSHCCETKSQSVDLVGEPLFFLEYLPPRLQESEQRIILARYKRTHRIDESNPACSPVIILRHRANDLPSKRQHLVAWSLVLDPLIRCLSIMNSFVPRDDHACVHHEPRE